MDRRRGCRRGEGDATFVDILTRASVKRSPATATAPWEKAGIRRIWTGEPEVQLRVPETERFRIIGTIPRAGTNIWHSWRKLHSVSEWKQRFLALSVSGCCLQQLLLGKLQLLWIGSAVVKATDSGAIAAILSRVRIPLLSCQCYHYCSARTVSVHSLLCWISYTPWMYSLCGWANAAKRQPLFIKKKNNFKETRAVINLWNPYIPDQFSSILCKLFCSKGMILSYIAEKGNLPPQNKIYL